MTATSDTDRIATFDTDRIASSGDRVPSHFDLAVVGGGLAGLVAAATAARAGRSVVLFDRASTLGGRARTRTDGGFAFNIGPHALYKSGHTLRILRDLGVEPRGAEPRLHGAHLIKDGRPYALPASPRSLLMSPLLDWRAKLEAAMFLGSVPKMNPRPLEGLTLRAWLDRSIRHQSVRDLVQILMRTASYADAPAELSAAAALRQLQIGLGGAVYLHGGWQTMVDDLRARAQALGVQIASGARVAEIELGTDGAGRAVQAVRLADGRRFGVGAAILAVPPQQANALVDDGREATLAGWAERAVPIRAASLDIGLKRLPRPNDWFALGWDQPLYLSVHSKWARLAPDGSALIHVLRYLKPNERPSPEHESELERLLDLMQPSWRDAVVTRRFMPDLVVAGALPSVTWEGRDGPRGPAVPGVAGLFVAGDWVGPEGMLADRATVSGARAGQQASLTMRAGAGLAERRAATPSIVRAGTVGNGVAAVSLAGGGA